MRTLVRVLTTLVVLIVFVTAAGLRANDTRKVVVEEPLITQDVTSRSGFRSNLGRTIPVGAYAKPVVWAELETVLAEFDGATFDGALAPSVDYNVDAFGLTPVVLAESSLDLLWPSQFDTSILLPGIPVQPLFDGLPVTNIENTSARVIQGVSSPQTIRLFRSAPPQFARGFISGFARTAPAQLSLFTFESHPKVYEEVIRTTFHSTTFAAPVPVPAGLPMLLGAIALLGVVRRRV